MAATWRGRGARAKGHVDAARQGHGLFSAGHGAGRRGPEAARCSCPLHGVCVLGEPDGDFGNGDRTVAEALEAEVGPGGSARQGAMGMPIEMKVAVGCLAEAPRIMGYDISTSWPIIDARQVEELRCAPWGDAASLRVSRERRGRPSSPSSPSATPCSTPSVQLSRLVIGFGAPILQFVTAERTKTGTPPG